MRVERTARRLRHPLQHACRLSKSKKASPWHLSSMPIAMGHRSVCQLIRATSPQVPGARSTE